MRKIYIILLIILTAPSLFAQQYINFHVDGSTDTYQIYESDSIFFDASYSILYFSNYGTVLEYNVSSIDSITYTTDASKNVYIDYSESNVTVTNPLSSNGVTVETDGANVTITTEADTKDINYICSGNTTNGSLKIYSEKRFNLLLNGLEITNPVGPAINIQSEKKATIHMVSGTDNWLTDGTTYDEAPVVNGEEEDQKATLFSEGQLVFIGGGNLTINSYGDDQHAIRSDEGIEVEEGVITIASAVKDGIHASEGFIMNGGTVNITSDGDGIDGDEYNIEINGGTIVINSESADVKGIACDSTMTINGGNITLNISGDQSKGLKSKQDIYLNGGTISGTAAGDVVLEAEGSGYDPSYCTMIKCDENLDIDGANLDFTTTGKASRGISCDGDMTINSGTVTIVSSGSGSTYTNSIGEKDAYHGVCFKVDGDLTFISGTITLSNSGSGGKGISCDGNIIIGDGTTVPVASLTTTGSEISISTSGWGPNSSTDAVESKTMKADQSITINSGELTISSADDGIKAEGTITINDGTISITKSYEGLEAPNIKIKGGSLETISSDDCINATYGNGGESNDGSMLTISGGYTFLSSTGGDPLDSNGNITISGGTVVIQGPQSNVEVGLDVNGTALVNGGFVVISGMNSNMAESFSSSSSQNFLTVTSQQTISSGTIIHLEKNDGTELFTFKPSRSYSFLIFSSSDLASGSTYKLYTGGSYSGTLENGLYTDGTYSAGTLKKTFTISQKSTTLNF
ncbi:carbohydrate-binding domain-containing protein [Draconibacterium sp. IB214405]|uniref:carbohydrate-binding domain-containing protein n=1 Tax=Draconibacterium sp. IB214405 TaxID=3097352 RepID=UPI002A17CC50|nr:carbohydrate-binding domain-containing protein [Draconibacterium sp. IB214405]MDX8339952.1 carbohydrate-binding domain-containing protein [Draconibacterium sp. IB214405]